MFTGPQLTPRLVWCSSRARRWLFRHIFCSSGVLQPSSAAKGMQRSPKIKERTSCPGDAPVYVGGQSMKACLWLSAVPTGGSPARFDKHSEKISVAFSLVEDSFFTLHSTQMQPCRLLFSPGQQLISKTSLETDYSVDPPPMIILLIFLERREITIFLPLSHMPGHLNQCL